RNSLDLGANGPNLGIRRYCDLRRSDFLKGEKPADLPVQASSKYQLVCQCERGACIVNTPAPSHLVMKRRAKFIRTLGICVFALVASAVIGFAIGACFQRPDGPSGGALWGMIAALGIFIDARPSLSSAAH